MTELLVVESVDGERIEFANPSMESRLAARRHELEEIGREHGRIERQLDRLSESRGSQSVEERVEDLLADSPQLRQLVRGDEAEPEQPSGAGMAAENRAHEALDALGLADSGTEHGAKEASRRRARELTAHDPELSRLVIGDQSDESEPDEREKAAVKLLRGRGYRVERGTAA